ncbi:MAG: hypothetical protein KatS3mg034_1306 [Vicingaceae bacterium]|nr:MAG: hypothetical protein KatS3mg034_1306 [Vicingaceae bacterium]
MRTTNFMKKIHQVMSPVKILNLIALLLAGNLASQSMPNLRVFLKLDDPWGCSNGLYVNKCLPQNGQILILNSSTTTYNLVNDTTVFFPLCIGGVYNNFLTYSEPGYSVNISVDLSNVHPNNNPTNYITYSVTQGNTGWWPSTFIFLFISNTSFSPCNGEIKVFSYGGSVSSGGTAFFQLFNVNTQTTTNSAAFNVNNLPYVTLTFTNLCPGSYGFTANDDSTLSCPQNNNYIYGNLEPIMCMLDTRPPKCYGECSGEVDLNYFPLNYSGFIDYTAGNNTVTLFIPPLNIPLDSTLCENTTVSVSLYHPWLNMPISCTNIIPSAPDSISIDLIINGGNVTANVQGGVQPYWYYWYDSNNNLISSGANVVNNLNNGNYYFVVVDSAGCSKTKNFTIGPTAVQYLNTKNQIYLFPNPAKDYLLIANLSSNSKIEIYNIEGRLIKAIINNTSQNELKIDITNLPDGVYYVSVKNTDGIIIESFKTIKLAD